MQTEKIYQLYIKPDKLTPIYIGRTKSTLQKRLKQHLQKAGSGSSKKDIAIKQLVMEGFEIAISELDRAESGKLCDLEQLHITNALGAGHELLNSTQGDTDRYEIVTSDEPSKPWSIADFESIDWDRSYVGTCIGEYGACVKGVSLYRRGWSKLRVVSPITGNVEIPGFIWERKIEKLLEMVNVRLETW